MSRRLLFVATLVATLSLPLMPTNPCHRSSR